MEYVWTQKSSYEREKMKEAKGGPVSRCFGPKTPAQEREDALKAALVEAAERRKVEPSLKRANAEINSCLQLSKGSLIKILPLVVNRVTDGRYPRLLLKVLLERIRRNQWDKLPAEDQCLVIRAEASLGEQIK